MFRLFFFIGILFLSIYFGVQVYQDPGYLLVSYGTWTLEMPAWLAIIIGVSIFLMTWVGLHFIEGILSIPTKLQAWFLKKHKEQAARDTMKGLLSLAEGQWYQAERYALKGLNYGNIPLANYLTAAKATHERASYELRDYYLTLAEEKIPDATVGIGLTRIQLYCQQGQFEKSLQLLLSLYNKYPKHTQILRLLTGVYQELHQYQAMIDLLPQLKKQKVFEGKILSELEYRAYRGLLVSTSQKEGKQAMIDLWHTFPKKRRQQAAMLDVYASELLVYKDHALAESVLRIYLRKHYSKELIKLYGLAETTETNKQMKVAERWLADYPHDATLMLTLGRLCVQQKLWGRAKDFFEASLTMLPSPETYAELGRLLGYLGEIEKSRDYYKQGLLATTEALSI